MRLLSCLLLFLIVGAAAEQTCCGQNTAVLLSLEVALTSETNMRRDQMVESTKSAMAGAPVPLQVDGLQDFNDTCGHSGQQAIGLTVPCIQIFFAIRVTSVEDGLLLIDYIQNSVGNLQDNHGVFTLVPNNMQRFCEGYSQPSGCVVSEQVKSSKLLQIAGYLNASNLFLVNGQPVESGGVSARIFDLVMVNSPNSSISSCIAKIANPTNILNCTESFSSDSLRVFRLEGSKVLARYFLWGVSEAASCSLKVKGLSFSSEDVVLAVPQDSTNEVCFFQPYEMFVQRGNLSTFLDNFGGILVRAEDLASPP